MEERGKRKDERRKTKEELGIGNWKLDVGIASSPSPRLDFAHRTLYRIGIMDDQWVKK